MGKAQLQLREDGRLDLDFHSQATALVVTSRSVGGYQATQLYAPQNWAQAVNEGVFIPMELVEDNDFRVRIVLGDLQGSESTDWIGRLSWKLSIDDGILTLASGIEYLIEDDKDAEFVQDLIRGVEVPSGDYQFDIYSYLATIHGDWDLPEGNKEPLGSYFRRTRDGQTMPDWLKSRLARHPHLDPGFEQDWLQEDVQMQRIEVWEELPPQIDFLIQLRPLTEESQIPSTMPELQDSLFRMAERRRPELFPFGLPSVDLVGPG